MIFPFEVKKNGVYYPAGTDVPIRSDKQRGAEKPPVDVPGKVDKADPVSVDKEVAEKKRKYTEDDLALPYMKLKSLASQNGIKVEKSAKAEEIKELLRAL